ncbi:Retrovirus-related Pol polyprotein from type-2 retrotransposable element R2DM [Araneus ventricosus]|uniref:Retrovirus-related Pol polyprotein from type-2 retrotransposable element R2DM n=1 Tax=Araneus ventricosus TaxID=182803 RepID=A0A4Y2LR64_ARAVE|nr:Retrovirus-related Pol polyprotein from type-2 retrotransposable element R2DM [Araneus ventricosus]
MSLMELSANDSIRQDITSIPEYAFSFNDTDSKIIDYLGLLFRSDRSSMLSNELKEAWNDFRLRPCKETLFIRTCLIFEVLLTDKTPSNAKPRGDRRAFPREALSRRVRRRIEYARAHRSFFRNPSRYSDSLLFPTNTLNEFDPFDDDFRMRVPDRFCRAKTIFLPKKKDASNPGDFRPISLTLLPAKLLSKILARRLTPTVSLDPEQRGFIESDGISQNTFMLDFVLRHSRERVRRTFIASLDLKKAFDSVSPVAVFAALKAQAVDPEFVELLKSIYKNSTISFAPFPNHRFSLPVV